MSAQNNTWKRHKKTIMQKTDYFITYADYFTMPED